MSEAGEASIEYEYSLKASIESSERIQRTTLTFDEEKTKKVMEEIVDELNAKELKNNC